MKDFGEREPLLSKTSYMLPCNPVLLAATANDAQPAFAHLEPKAQKTGEIPGRRMVVEIALDHALQPFPDFPQWLMHAPPKRDFHLFQLSEESLSDGLAQHEELAVLPGPSADVREPKKLNVSGLPSPRRFRFSAAKRPNSISRVLSGCSSRPNFRSRSRQSWRKRSASARRPDCILGDRAYDAEKIRRALCARHISPLLAMRNTENGSGLGRWRWVIERTFAWLNQFRRLRLRYEKRAEMHKALLSLACALICWNFLQGHFRDLRLPNRQAADERIEERFFFMP